MNSTQWALIRRQAGATARDSSALKLKVDALEQWLAVINFQADNREQLDAMIEYVRDHLLDVLECAEELSTYSSQRSASKAARLLFELDERELEIDTEPPGEAERVLQASWEALTGSLVDHNGHQEVPPDMERHNELCREYYSLTGVKLTPAVDYSGCGN